MPLPVVLPFIRGVQDRDTSVCVCVCMGAHAQPGNVTICDRISLGKCLFFGIFLVVDFLV